MMTETFFFFFFFSDVKMAHDDFPISQMYYTPITCFLTFNICAVLGNLIPSILRFVSVLKFPEIRLTIDILSIYIFVFSPHPDG